MPQELAAKTLNQVRRILQKPSDKRTPEDLRKLHDGLLKNVAFFQNVEYDVRLNCCALLKYKSYGASEIVFEEGDEGFNFYIIIEGSVAVWLRDVSAEEVAEEAKRKAEEEQKLAEEEAERLKHEQQNNESPNSRMDILRKQGNASANFAKAAAFRRTVKVNNEREHIESPPDSPGPTGRKSDNSDPNGPNSSAIRQTVAAAIDLDLFLNEDEDAGSDDKDEDDEGEEASFLDYDEDEDEDQDPEDPPAAPDAADGEPPDDHPMNQHRRRGVIEDGEDPTTPPIAEDVASSTTSTTTYPLGVVEPDEVMTGPIQMHPTGGATHWATQIAVDQPNHGVMPVSECTGRRREDRRRESCKGSYRRRRRTDIYGARAAEECQDRRRVSDRRRICESFGTRRRRSRRRDPSVERRRRLRRRRAGQDAIHYANPTGDRRRRLSEGDGIWSSFSLQEGDMDMLPVTGDIPENDASNKTANYKGMAAKTSELDRSFKSMSGDATRLMDQSAEMLKQLDDTSNSSTVNSSTVDSKNGAGLKPLATPDTLTADAQAALLRRHFN
eukprot:gnl/MRDRNA2_/MRDRNA2_42460_c0_seq1.p1 gnl/MRDRNA2_/MRDRNA2_42460_c0~~gnl/MRDRNA2_/MRDRNA2_42460_c0_seq1.p1  ORF type:complete len:554 (+),score=117.50 gnl/MRDRNA2_/MRDRNA2_42460_c0_seq1:161-1822(+)